MEATARVDCINHSEPEIPIEKKQKYFFLNRKMAEADRNNKINLTHSVKIIHFWTEANVP